MRRLTVQPSEDTRQDTGGWSLVQEQQYVDRDTQPVGLTDFRTEVTEQFGTLWDRALDIQIDMNRLREEVKLLGATIRRYTEKEELAVGKLSDETIVEGMLEADWVVRMPPVMQSARRVKVRRIGKATPRIVAPDEFDE